MRTVVEELVDDARAGTAVAGVYRVACGCGIEDIGRGHDAETLALGAVQVLAEVFDARVVEGVDGIVGEDAFFIVVVLVAAHISRHAG